MKDEEMAEQFANNGYALGCTKTPFESAKEGFLAGLKAGRPQWHDLRENPNDLPPRMGLDSEEVYVQYDIKGVTDFACYRFDKNIWERSEDNEQAFGVIAWCEIPTFDKE